MKSTTLVRLASQSILKNKMRSMLTMLGVIIGVAAVIVMVAVGYGARSRIHEQINNLGTNGFHHASLADWGGRLGAIQGCAL